MTGVVDEAYGAGARRIQSAHELTHAGKHHAPPRIFDWGEDLEAVAAQGLPDDGYIVVWVFEDAHGRVVGLVADQQGNLCFRAHMRRQQNNQKSNERSPQHERAPMILGEYRVNNLL
jgi:hypothetical protein